MGFADTYLEAWKARLRGLVQPGPLTLHLTPNTEAEDLTCLLCGRGGAGMHGVTPEWLVTMRNPSQTVTAGVHEDCRKTHQGSRFSKEPTDPPR